MFVFNVDGIIDKISSMSNELSKPEFKDLADNAFKVVNSF